jgi:hypothetical protein
LNFVFQVGLDDDRDPPGNCPGIDEAAGTGSRVEVEEVCGRGEDEWVPCLENLVDVLVLDGDSATRRFGPGFHTDPVCAEEMTGRSFGCPAIS